MNWVVAAHWHAVTPSIHGFFFFPTTQPSTTQEDEEEEEALMEYGGY
jgi:hypothetical protein